MRLPPLPPLALLVAGLCAFAPPTARAIDLKQAVIFEAAGTGGPARMAAVMLAEEVAKRSRVVLPLVSQWPADGRPVIAIGAGAGVDGLPGRYASRLPAAPAGPEGFRVQTMDQVIVIAGNSPSATVFGVGYLLRHLRMDFDPLTEGRTLETVHDFHASSSPHHRLRGTQISYRPKVNSYDGWTPAIFEQYVRDLAVFGINSIELMAPRSDDDDQSEMFPLSKIDMLAEMSRITHEYGLQVWIFYPTMDTKYSPAWRNPSVPYHYDNPRDVAAAVAEWGEVFKRVPYIDGIFVPGGDPGNTEPKYLLPLLEKQAASLHRTHPDAQMWMSTQQFNAQWMDEFFAYLKTNPPWLAGLCYGPGIRQSLKEFRAMLPARYPIRLYPDITHSVHAEYPVPNWDLAYALTEGREGYNPRPVDMAKIFHFTDGATVGTIAYSEGVNDDVNKIIWASLDWNPHQEVKAILRQYARYFLGPRLEEGVSEGILNLERDWRGPLLTNGQVDTTFDQFRTMEKEATPGELLNWRFQQMLFRAYYDRYVKTRLIYETALEQEALEKLRDAPAMGSLAAMNEAERILERSVTHPVGADLRGRLYELAAALFQSIRAQLSVDRYKAVAISRGADLDTADFPLNNRHWLENRFAELRGMPAELARLEGIDRILNRTNPGPGGYYDDLGNPSRQPHLVIPTDFDHDPEFLNAPKSNHLAFGGGPMGRRSADATRLDGPASFLNYPQEWWSFAETRYECPLIMQYRDLDPHSRYKVRVVYVSRSSREGRVRLFANDGIVIHPYMTKPAPFGQLEFDIPPEATAKGDLRLRWEGEPGGGGTGQGPIIAEVFLIRK